MGKRKDIDLEWEDDEDYSPTGYERRSDESDEDYQERMEDYESYIRVTPCQAPRDPRNSSHEVCSM